jgi:hypothetical protein
VTWRQRHGAARRARTQRLREMGIAAPSKYGAVPTVLDGIRFASKREADRYAQLRVLELAGRITHLQLQPAFDLHALGGVRVARYVADFAYRDEHTQRLVIEDVKGVKTPVFRLKAKWLKAEHGIDVQCV